jgi:hypothetical protein
VSFFSTIVWLPMPQAKIDEEVVPGLQASERPSGRRGRHRACGH